MKGRHGKTLSDYDIIAYLSELLIEVNLVLSLVPRPFTTAMMASEMPAAISPYSGTGFVSEERAKCFHEV
jgi:hypothetical protein